MFHTYRRFDFSDWFQLVEAEGDVRHDIRRYPSGGRDPIYAKSSGYDHNGQFSKHLNVLKSSNGRINIIFR
jgi:hypothetical protein